MPETWYILDDGAFADPADVAPDAKGALRHKNGVAVAMAGSVPRTRWMSDDEVSSYRSSELKPERPARGYKTRATKA